jgi:hypothetical protein
MAVAFQLVARDPAIIPASGRKLTFSVLPEIAGKQLL